MQKRKILLIYTGGTIGMISDTISGALKPFDFSQITEQVPELKKLKCQIDTLLSPKPIDSSNMQPDIWVTLAEDIAKQYEQYDGFVVLHGSDTMAYTASALSFMLQNLSKPIVFTGSQLPIGTIRTDGKENLITAIEIASSYQNDQPQVPEVSIYFEYKLYRANRTTKLSADDFEAFESFNYPRLAEAGVEIAYNSPYILPVANGGLAINKTINANVAILKLFPGIALSFIQHFFASPGLKGVVIETFGGGNAPSSTDFLQLLSNAIAKGLVIVNVTQCKRGTVEQTRYETGHGLAQAGVISGKDMTLEAALTKLMIVLGKHSEEKQIVKAFTDPWCGEK